jgi:hypothetical protein
MSLVQPNERGAVELSNGTKVPQNPSLPKLNLTNQQRERWTADRWPRSSSRAGRRDGIACTHSRAPDVTGLVIYFSVASLILRGTLL